MVENQVVSCRKDAKYWREAAMEIYQAVGQNIHRIRKAQQLSIDRAAALSGVSKSMLGQIERGLVNPTVSVLARIAGGLHVPIEQLVECARRPRHSCTGRSTSSARGSAAGRSSAIRSSPLTPTADARAASSTSSSAAAMTRRPRPRQPRLPHRPLRDAAGNGRGRDVPAREPGQPVHPRRRGVSL